MLFTTDGGAFGPATIRAGSVGIKKAMANVMIETMNRVKNNQATLRSAYAAISAPLLPVPVLIHLVPDRMEISPLDIRISEEGLLFIPERHYRVVGQDLLLDLLVKRQALALIFHCNSLIQLFVHRWVGVVARVVRRNLIGVELHVQEVRGIRIVLAPAEHSRLGLAGFSPFYPLAKGDAVQIHLDAHVRKVLLDHLVDLGLVAGVKVPEFHAEPVGISGLLEQRFGLVRVVGRRAF